MSNPALPRILGVASRRSTTGGGWFLRQQTGLLVVWVFLAMFVVSIFAEVIANERPILVLYDGKPYFPVSHRLSGDCVRRRI